MGSRPIRPDFASPKSGLPPLVMSANTQRICRVADAQAKLTWPGSEATSGFLQAVAASAVPVATLDGQEALPPERTITRMVTNAATAADPATVSCRRETFR